MSIWGVDVSNHQGGGIDWGAANLAGIRFGWAKVCEDSSYVDPYWRGNRDRALAAGIRFGGYHYAHPNTDPVRQAHWFCDLHGPMVAGMLRPALDLEEAFGVGRVGVHAWARTWMDVVESVLGVAPVLYTYPYFWQSAAGCPTGCCARNPLWFASYTSRQPAPPAPWSKITAWQYAGTSARIPGIPGLNDANWWVSTEEDLHALTYGSTPVPIDKDEDDDMRLVRTVEDGAVWALVPGLDPRHLNPEEEESAIACGVKPPVDVNQREKDVMGALINSAGK